MRLKRGTTRSSTPKIVGAVSIALLSILILSVSALAFNTGQLYLTDFADLGPDNICGRGSDSSNQRLSDCNSDVFKGSGPGTCSLDGKTGCLFWQPPHDSRVDATLTVEDLPEGSGTLTVWTSNFGGGSQMDERVDVFVNGQLVGTTSDLHCNNVHHDDCEFPGFVIDDFSVNVKEGDNDVRFRAVSNGGSLTVTKFRLNYEETPDPDPSCSLKFDPKTVDEGESTEMKLVNNFGESYTIVCDGDIGAFTDDDVREGKDVTFDVTPSESQECVAVLYADEDFRGESDTCNAEITVVPAPPVCGDGVVEAPETCDDGNTVSGDGCSATCQIEDPPSCTADFDPDSILLGETSELTISNMNAQSVEVFCDGDIGIAPINVPANSTQDYDTLPGVSQTCTVTVHALPFFQGQSATCEASVVVNDVPPPVEPSCELNFNPDEITEGEVSVAELDTFNAQSLSYSCDGDIGSGSDDSIIVNASFDFDVFPTESQSCTVTVYELEDFGGLSAECSDDIVVNPIVDPVCGDGVVEAPETCDDGNTVSGDGCSATCQVELPPACEAFFNPNPVEEGETTALNIENDNALSYTFTCDGDIPDGDDPNIASNSTNTVDTMPTESQTCTVTVYALEDFGGQTATCDASITVEEDDDPVCGNSIVEDGETCDDGNTVSGDGCSDVCQLEPTPTCTLEFDPDSITNGSATTLTLTNTDALSYDIVCDGDISDISDSSAVPNSSVGFGLSPTESQSCTATVYGLEDFAGLNSTCDASITVDDVPPVCGNGIVEDGETCDDGNTVSGDGCSATCQVELAPACEAFFNPDPVDEGETTALNIDNDNALSYMFTCDGDIPDGQDNSIAANSTNTVDTMPTVSQNCTVTVFALADFGGQNTTCDASITVEEDDDPVCGNSIVEDGETCDDGNTVSGDGCSEVCQLEPTPTCTLEFDPDSITNGSSTTLTLSNTDALSYDIICDGDLADISDSSAVPNSSVGFGLSPTESQSCTATVYGLEDFAGLNSTCDASITVDDVPPVCGNGIVEDGETCDDGNTDDGDGCSSTCQTELPPSCTVEFDPDSIVDGESSNFSITNMNSQSYTVSCDGDLVIADDSSVVSNSTTTVSVSPSESQTCTVTVYALEDFAGQSAQCSDDVTVTDAAVCGNGIVEDGETCDDGNTLDGDGCSSVCELEPAVCGNGIQEMGEQCDDGNTLDGDGCSAICEIEACFLQDYYSLRGYDGEITQIEATGLDLSEYDLTNITTEYISFSANLFGIGNPSLFGGYVSLTARGNIPDPEDPEDTLRVSLRVKGKPTAVIENSCGLLEVKNIWWSQNTLDVQGNPPITTTYDFIGYEWDRDNDILTIEGTGPDLNFRVEDIPVSCLNCGI